MKVNQKLQRIRNICLIKDVTNGSKNKTGEENFLLQISTLHNLLFNNKCLKQTTYNTALLTKPKQIGQFN